MSALAELLDKFAPEKWRCMKCGCLWRLNPPWSEPYKPPLLGERSWSLWDSAQKSCAVCDNSPEFMNVIVPAAQSVDELLAQAISALERERSARRNALKDSA